MDLEEVEWMKFDVGEDPSGEFVGGWLRIGGPDGEVRVFLTRTQLRDLQKGAEVAHSKIAI
ncbi:MAG: hypothetical protein ACR2NA_07555 [Solirubrobacterales bacterium]